MSPQSKAPIKAPKKPPTYHQDDAVRMVQQRLGRKLTRIEERVVREEGFVDGTYRDTKGILTGGVGQTGKWIQKGFEASFNHHVDRVRNRIPAFDKMPPEIQEELVQAEYRGDLGLSPKAVKLINSGQFRKAAVEFLDNDEFRDPKTPASIKRRMKSVADALLTFGNQLQKQQATP